MSLTNNAAIASEQNFFGPEPNRNSSVSESASARNEVNTSSSSDALSANSPIEESPVSEGRYANRPSEWDAESNPTGAYQEPLGHVPLGHDAISQPIPHARAGRMETASDYKVFRAINNLLVKKLNKAAARVTVDVTKGHCILHGEVRCYYEMQLAQEAALRTSGVRSVQNLINVVND